MEETRIQQLSKICYDPEVNKRPNIGLNALTKFLSVHPLRGVDSSSSIFGVVDRNYHHRQLLHILGDLYAIATFILVQTYQYA